MEEISPKSNNRRSCDGLGYVLSSHLVYVKD